MPPALRHLFPDRVKRARRMMERAAASHEGGVFHETRDGFFITLPAEGPGRCSAREALANRLIKQCHAPVLPHVAAKRLGIVPEELKALESCGLRPSLQVPTSRHGKHYTLRAFSLSDMEALALHLAGGRAEA